MVGGRAMRYRLGFAGIREYASSIRPPVQFSKHGHCASDRTRDGWVQRHPARKFRSVTLIGDNFHRADY